MGIREDSSKEVLSYTIAPTESAYVWKELLQDIRERGADEVLFFISDGLKGMANAIFEVFPAATYQTCCVHLARNLAHKVRVSDRAEICEDFKTVYRSEHEEGGREALKSFCDKWKSAYPKAVKGILDNPYIYVL